MRSGPVVLAASAVLALASLVGAAEPSARAIIEATGVKGGLVVHLGCGDGTLTAELHASNSYVVHGLDAAAASVEKARAHIRSLGLYGPVCAERWVTEPSLPYTDNLVNLLVAQDLGDVPMAEVRRTRPRDQEFFNVGMPHHRCHRDRATSRYLILARAGAEFIDVKTGHQPEGVVEVFDLPGALPDVLSSDGGLVYMRHVGFDREGKEQKATKPHLFSPTGLLDDTWWHRSYWIYGTRYYMGYRDWFRAGREVPGGRMLVFSGDAVYGYGRRPADYYWTTPIEYHLFATTKQPGVIPSPDKRPRVPGWGQKQIVHRWSTPVPLLVRAMALAGDTLFIAGPPDVVEEWQAYKSLPEPATAAALAAQEAALAGKSGGLLQAIFVADGKALSELSLDSPPVWDGLAAAGGRLYLATMDGTLACFGKADSR